MADLPQIYLTQNDLDRLLQLVEAQPGKQLREAGRRAGAREGGAA